MFKKKRSNHVDYSHHITVPVENADLFYACLDHRTSLFQRHPYRWIFRGHMQEAWRLHPSIFRSTCMVFTSEHWEPVSSIVTEGQQVFAEAWLLHRFIQQADRAGLRLPEDSRNMRRLLERILSATANSTRGEIEWPQQELLSLMALAQHHGVPTRLLDWTRNAYKAAYFAAIGAVKAMNDPTKKASVIPARERIAVWAYCAALESEFEPGERFSRHVDLSRICMITTAGGGNPNLTTQEGLHLVYAPLKVALEAPANRPPMDLSLTRSQRNVKSFLLYKFTLPWKECPRLLALLHRTGIDATTMFPGFDGVAGAVLEMQWWFDSVRQDWHGQ